MNILIACEESQAVCIAFRQRGHNAYSVDIQPCSGGHPEWHIMDDALKYIDGDCEFITCDGVVHKISGEWDMLIAHPPCTDLACSGAAWFAKKIADGTQEKSKNFFLKFTNAKCNRIVIENPVGIMSTYYRKPDQIIQPWQFGENYQKTTCLWYIGDVPKLIATTVDKPKIEYHTWTDKYGRTKRQSLWYYNTRRQGKLRGKIASKTPVGVANAMAEQWG